MQFRDSHAQVKHPNAHRKEPRRLFVKRAGVARAGSEALRDSGGGGTISMVDEHELRPCCSASEPREGAPKFITPLFLSLSSLWSPLRLSVDRCRMRHAQHREALLFNLQLLSRANHFRRPAHACHDDALINQCAGRSNVDHSTVFCNLIAIYISIYTPLGKFITVTTILKLMQLILDLRTFS